MRKSKFTEYQIIAALKQFEFDTPVIDVYRLLGISQANFYKWKTKYGGLDTSELPHNRDLEDDNRRLIQMYPCLSLHAHAMEVVLAKKYCPSTRSAMP